MTEYSQYIRETQKQWIRQAREIKQNEWDRIPFVHCPPYSAVISMDEAANLLEAFTDDPWDYQEFGKGHPIHVNGMRLTRINAYQVKAQV